MNTLNEINDFLEPQKIAIAGVSRNPKKFGAVVFKELSGKGYQLFPINPNAEEINGAKCYSSVAELPGDVHHLLVVTPKKQTEAVVRQAIEKGIKRIWIQQGSDTPEAVEMARKAGIPLVYKKCILMFADPVSGVHGFHRFLSKMFGGYPKMVAPSAN